MTFNQWCAGKNLSRSSRLALEAVWNSMVANGIDASQCNKLLRDVYGAFEEEYHDAF